MTETGTYNEAELVIALKKKENTAFRYLYLHYRGALLSIITQIIPDEETANDVLQESIITIWKNIDKYDPAKGRLYTWLLNVTRNTAINKIRSKEYKNSLKNESTENLVYKPEASFDIETKITQIGLRKMVREMRTEYRDVLELAYFHGLTQEEISRALNIPLGTVKTRLRNSILELRKKFR